MGLLWRLASWICAPLFKAIDDVYRLFYGLASTKLFNNDVIKTVSNNLYIFVSVVILFAFAIKLVEAIVNPDLLTDAKKGVTGILKRTIIGLILIVIIPNAFTLLYYFQAEILSTKLVEKLVLGYTDTTADINNSGGILTSSIIRGFVYPVDSDGRPITEYTLCEDDNDCNYADELLSKYDSSITAHYETEYLPLIGGDPDYDKLGDLNFDVKWPDTDQGIYYFNGFLLLLTGIYILYQVIVLCFDAALRLVNLGILEIIAPIIIVSYIGGGTDYLSKWAKMVGEKFLSIFIRIAALAFMILGLSLMKESEIFNSQSTSWLFQLLVIIGLLRLVKDLPNIFSKIFGVDIKSGGGIKDRLGEMAGVGKLAQNAWGAIPGLAAGAATVAGKHLQTAGKYVGKGAGFLGNKAWNSKFVTGARNVVATGFDKVGGNKLVDKIKTNKGLNKIGRGARKFGSGAAYLASKGIDTAKRDAQVMKAGAKSGGKGVVKAVSSAYNEAYKDKVAAEKHRKEDAAKAKMNQRLAAAAGVQLKDGKFQFDINAQGIIKGSGKEWAKKDNVQKSAQDFHNRMIDSMNLSSDTKKKLRDANETQAKFSSAQFSNSLRESMNSEISKLYGATKDQEQKNAFTELQNKLERGDIKNVSDFKKELESINKLGEGKKDSLTGNAFNTLSSSLTGYARIAQNNDSLGTESLVLSQNLKTASDKVTASNEALTKHEGELLGKEQEEYKNMVSNMKKGYTSYNNEIQRQAFADANTLPEAEHIESEHEVSGYRPGAYSESVPSVEPSSAAPEASASASTAAPQGRPGGSTTAEEHSNAVEQIKSNSNTENSSPAPQQVNNTTIINNEAPASNSTETSQSNQVESSNSQSQEGAPANNDNQGGRTNASSENVKVDVDDLRSEFERLNSSINESGSRVADAVTSSGESMTNEMKESNKKLNTIGRDIKTTNKTISGMRDDMNKQLGGINSEISSMGDSMEKTVKNTNDMNDKLDSSGGDNE